MTTIGLKLKHCADGCPHCKSFPTPRSGFAYDFHCDLVKDPTDDSGIKMVMGYVEYKSDYRPVPDWCPLRLKE